MRIKLLIFFAASALVSGQVVTRHGGTGGGGGAWGSITGTLASQTDLNAALTARLVATANLSDLSSSMTARVNLGLGNVENTALSTWTGSANLVTLGTIATGAWHATKIGLLYGGTNSDLSGTGGPHFFLRQNSSGAAIDAVRPSCADLSDSGTGCPATLPTFPSGAILGTSDSQTLSGKTYSNPSLGAGASPLTETWTVGAGGVTANTLVQTDASAPLKIVAATTGVYGVAMSTVSAAGSVEVARLATVNCTVDTGGSTAGNLVIMGAAGTCRDAGAASSAAVSIATRIVGVFRSSVTAGSTALVELTPAHFGTQVNAFPSPGTSTTLSGQSEIFVCTGACTVTVPVPAAGVQYCVMNDDNVATVITLSAIGSSAMYETQARTAYGTAGTGPMVSSGAVGDAICLIGRDSTHYLVASSAGSWTAN